MKTLQQIRAALRADRPDYIGHDALLDLIDWLADPSRERATPEPARPASAGEKANPSGRADIDAAYERGFAAGRLTSTCEHAGHAARILELENGRRLWKSKYAIAADECNAANRRAEAAEREREEWRATVGRLHDEWAAVIAERDELRARLTEAESVMGVGLRDMTKDRDRACAEIDELRGKLETAEAKRDEWQEMADSYEMARRAWQARAETAEAALDEMTAERDAHRDAADAADADRKAAVATARAEALAAVLKELRDEDSWITDLASGYLCVRDSMRDLADNIRALECFEVAKDPAK